MVAPQTLAHALHGAAAVAGPDQNVAQGTVFTIDAPPFQPWCAAARRKPSPQVHHEFPGG
jgi:hypothetical protein